ncbi:outer-membrane lipoprotein carrier protein LolA [Sulfurospirillum sp. T05]|uniref:Outer-membrane lipoprotein carrier protein LolA n=1 Tax=Sulfurospirillum tamanense TaxID=2813362 RepID=A0ABS2WRD9_9BACT|nr:LolA-like outer membrane lipoprotein chaperone [Sulfurospirillum tamanensis]MBN2964195.1 outer-membrane lipoprotein carrier protein LolA [Sulfurospirillum tamanensis]
MRILWLLLLGLSLHASAFETLSSTFKQTLSSPEGTTIVYHGTLHANAHNQALWSYTQPIEKQIYFNDTAVLIVEPELEQAISTSLETTQNLALFLQEASGKKTHTVEHEGVVYTITFQDNLPYTVTYQDVLENNVVIEFSNVELNEPLPLDIFLPHVPSHFDKIRQ